MADSHDTELLQPNERQLIGAHNSTLSYPAFLLPVFGRASGNARYYQVLSSDLSIVRDFEVLSESYAVEPLEYPAPVAVGCAAIHVFASSAGTLVGTKPELSVRLLSLIDQAELLEVPILRLEVVDFCDADHKRREAAQQAYLFLRDLSRYSADFWRNRTYLTTQARRWLHRPLENAGLPIAASQSLLESVEFVYTERIARVDIGSELFDELRRTTPLNISNFLSEGLQKYLAAFDLKPVRFELRVDGANTVSAGAAQSGFTRLSEYKDVVRVAIPIGRPASLAMRGTSNGVARCAVYLDEDIVDAASIERCLNEVARFSEGRADQSHPGPLLIPIVDAHAVDIDLLETFTDLVNEGIEIHLAILYRTRDGEPAFPLISLTSRMRRKVKGVTVIPDNDFPLGEAIGKTSRPAVLRSFLSFVNMVCERDRSEVLHGTALYGLGRARGGIENYQAALRKSVASTANPILPLTLVASAFGLLSSVGTPSSTIQRDAEEYLNAALEAQLSKHIQFEVLWRKRAFAPGWSVPATFEFLAKIEPIVAVVDGLAEAAKTILLLQDFQISITSEKGSIFNIVRGRESIHVSTQRDQEVGFPYVWVALSKHRQQAYLRTISKIGDVFPLLLGDLAYLAGNRGVVWAAKVMAICAYPKSMLSEAIRDFVEDTLRSEVLQNRAQYFEHELNGMLPSGLSLEMERVDKLRGRRISVSGTARLSFGSEPTVPPAEATRRVPVTITIGPDEFDCRTSL